MYPSVTAQNDTAALIADQVRENMIACASKLGVHVPHLFNFKDAGRIIGGSLSPEED